MKNLRKEKLLIIATVFIDVIGIGVVIPVMPFYAQSFGMSPFLITLMFSVFSLFAFLSAPLLGSFSDRIGRRPILIISLLSTAIGWFVFASAKSITFLFLGRIIDGLAAGNYPIAQGYLTDISRDDKERTANMGLIGAIFGIGFIFGPMIGGLLANISTAAPFFFVGIISAINTIAAFFFLPESHHQRTLQPLSFNPIRPLKTALIDKSLRLRYLIVFLFNTAIAMQQAIFALYLYDIFGFKTAMVGYVMTATGVMMAVNQGVLLKRFWLNKFSEAKLEVWMFLVLAISHALLLFGNIPTLIISMFLMVASQSVLHVVIASRIVGLASQEKRGEILGVTSSIQSAAAIVGPLFSGIIYNSHRSLTFIASISLLLVAFFIMKKFASKNRQSEKNLTADDLVSVETI
ncbi:MAG TPA: MFS transporter [bacterium]|nr:MFS transporter [bacterium]